jgi:hypothetical protein
VSKLQIALKRGSYEDYKEFSAAADGSPETAATLRGLFRFKEGLRPRCRSKRSSPRARS